MQDPPMQLQSTRLTPASGRAWQTSNKAQRQLALAIHSVLKLFISARGGTFEYKRITKNEARTGRYLTN